MRSSSAVFVIAAGFVLFFSIEMSMAGADASTAFSARSPLPLNAARKLPSDLEVGADLMGLPAETTHYVTGLREEWSAVPNFVRLAMQ
jgi:hypothetical protein